MVDLDADGYLGINDFLDIIDLMEIVPRIYDNSYRFWKVFRNFCNKYLKFDKIAKSYYYDMFILFVVLLNFISIIVYLSVSDKEENVFDILESADTVFNSIYIADVIIKIIAYGVEDYFSHFWYQFDFTMVIITITTMIG